MNPFGRRDALKLGLTSLVAGGCARPSSGPAVLTPAPASLVAAAPLPPLPKKFTLAFGSCNRPTLPQPLWSDVANLAPDAWAWLGDNVYADTTDIRRTRRLYAEQAARQDYAALAASTRVVGIWDDHDFGRNDAGGEYPKKAESQAALLDFLGEPEDSPRRAQLGTYASYVFGERERQVKLILLDGRYHRDKPFSRGDTLGEEQWAWLENELKTSTAQVHLVASGYQVLPLDQVQEKWGNFPTARLRLLELLRTARTPGVLFLSGDRHFAELSCLCDGSFSYPLYELTSSGLTHYDDVREKNRFRVGSVFARRNFGAVQVDWEAGTVTLEARGVGGDAAIKQSVSLASLRA